VISAFGNLVGVLIGQSRLLREVGRQGTLPYPRFWSSTRPFGTPLGAYLLKWVMTLIMIVAPPAGDAFNFSGSAICHSFRQAPDPEPTVVDLAIYPASFFLFLMTLGIYFIRRQRERLGLGRAEYHAWDVAIIFFLAVQVFLLIMPWYPPRESKHSTFIWASLITRQLADAMAAMLASGTEPTRPSA
jgi:amino acid transporter